jgi:hypothetical protein
MARFKKSPAADHLAVRGHSLIGRHTARLCQRGALDSPEDQVSYCYASIHVGQRAQSRVHDAGPGDQREVQGQMTGDSA